MKRQLTLYSLMIIFFGCAVSAVMFLTNLLYEYDKSFLENIRGEPHGLWLILLVIGILVLWLSKLAEHHQAIKRYYEEIEDFLGWQEPEAAYRIAGNIKRLNRKGITKIKLDHVYLRNAPLSDANLSGADLRGADLREADLRKACLMNVDLLGSNLSRANLTGAFLSGTDLSQANLSEANFRGADLSGANLSGAILSGADLEGAKLYGANLSGADLSEAKIQRACYNRTTIWPASFDPTRAGIVSRDFVLS